MFNQRKLPLQPIRSLSNSLSSRIESQCKGIFLRILCYWHAISSWILSKII